MRCQSPLENRKYTMAFSEMTVAEAFKRANGRCECGRTKCRHGLRCNKALDWRQRGNDFAVGGWEAHHRTASGVGG